MKKLNFTFLFTMLMSMVGLIASAHNIEVKNADGKTIYYDFFNNNTELAVTYRGSSSYSYLNEYTGNVVIPESVTYNEKTYRVTSIGSYAFEGCSGLTSVTIPENVYWVGYGVFEGCSRLTSIMVENGNSKYDSRDNCNAIIETSSNTLIQGCNNTVIPNSVTSIGDSAFDGCSGLTSITIPNSVTSIGNRAFYRCTGLTSVTIPNSVTSIGYHAFYDCSGLTSVTIPNSVTSIGDLAFYNTAWYNNLPDGLVYAGKVAYKYKGTMPENTSITIKDGTLGIAGGAFSGCSSLTSVTIPNSVTSIGNLAFYDCSGLTSITIPNSVTSIGASAFLGCSGLTSIAVENSNSIYDSREDCNALIETSSNTLIQGCKNTVIPNSVKSIGSSAFSGCSGLTSVTIPNSVTSIGESAFRGCSGLTSVTIPNSVTSIGNYAFRDCSGLTSVTIPNSVTSIGDCAFYDCSGLTSVTIPNSVTSIGWYAFVDCSGLTSVTIPNSVTSIGYQAFSGCSGLTSVTIGTGVTSIGDYAFSGCSGLTSVTFHCNNVGTWFKGRSSIKEVWIEKEVTSIAQQSFAGCSGLQSVYNNAEDAFAIAKNTFDDATYSSATLYVPTGMKATYEDTQWWLSFNKKEEYDFPTASGTCGENLTWAYYEDDKKLVISGTGAMVDYDGNSLAPWNSYRDNIENVVFVEGVTSIGNFAFRKCSGLTSITIPNSVTSIGTHAFYYCSKLSSVTIGNNVTSIGNDAFSGCSAITSIKVQEENTKYDSREDCNAIIETASNTLIVGCKSSVIPNNVTSIGESAFENCAGLTSIIIPNSVTSIEKDAFEDCRDLTSLSLGENVKSIGVRAFNQCTALTSVSIPNSVTSIETDAFDDCTALTSIYSYIENPTNDTGANFDSSNYSNATLYVPFGTKDKYLSTTGWKNFAKIVEMGETAVKDVSASNTNEAKYYSLDGKQFSQPKKGLNILKMSDGTTRRVVR